MGCFTPSSSCRVTQTHACIAAFPCSFRTDSLLPYALLFPPTCCFIGCSLEQAGNGVAAQVRCSVCESSLAQLIDQDFSATPHTPAASINTTLTYLWAYYYAHRCWPRSAACSPATAPLLLSPPRSRKSPSRAARRVCCRRSTASSPARRPLPRRCRTRPCPWRTCKPRATAGQDGPITPHVRNKG